MCFAVGSVTMSFRDLTFLVAAMGHLALAALATYRREKNPVALPIGLLSLVLFGWAFAVVCHHRFVGDMWRTLDLLLTAISPPLLLRVVLTFAGRMREHRRLLRLSYAWYALLALVTTWAFFDPRGVPFNESFWWASWFLAGWVPMLVYTPVVLVRHLRSVGDADEKARTRLVLASILVGEVFASTDVVHDMGVPVPALAPVGTLASTLLMAIAVLRFGLFERTLGALHMVYATSVAAAFVLLYLTLFQGLSGNLPALTFAITVVTLALTAVVREAAASHSEERERRERLTVLGRFAAQMAHDLKNPLAALIGAVDVLEGQSKARGEDETFLHLMRDQASRIRTIVQTYDRLGRVEPHRALVDMGDLVTRVCALKQFGQGEVRVRAHLPESAPRAEADGDLLASALENLVQNALEASPRGAADIEVTVSRDDTGMWIISVEDHGDGMDPRQAERAFDDFFTTKVTGSGLGLAFVRRVALAHGGDVALRSRKGEGTRVELRFPG